MAELDPAAGFTPTDGRAEFASGEAGVNVRLALAPTVQGENMTLRLLRAERERMDLDAVGLSAPDLKAIRRAMGDSEGMLLVSGPTGSGKTTTLYALLAEFRALGCGVVSIEDPVECVLDGVAQIEINERVGLTFHEGVKGVLRLDPDVIAMGEMRDPNSAKAAVDAADSGHVVVSSLHARDAVGTITSLRNFGLRDHEISASLDMVVAQRLVRRLCVQCRQRGAPSEDDAEWLRFFGQPVPESAWRAPGCAACNMTGYKGRVGVFEVWRLVETDADLILRGADEHAIRRLVRKEGTLSMLDDDLLKVSDGVTSLEEIRRLGGLGFYLPR
jgi:type II secretory ATPase GspE/PulE/Tfp pilus assembly ATPase PilB-like protein